MPHVNKQSCVLLFFLDLQGCYAQKAEVYIQG